MRLGQAPVALLLPFEIIFYPHGDRQVALRLLNIQLAIQRSSFTVSVFHSALEVLSNSSRLSIEFELEFDGTVRRRNCGIRKPNPPEFALVLVVAAFDIISLAE